MVWGAFAYRAAVSALACTVLLTIVMGLMHHGLENKLIFWPFVLAYVYLAMILGMAVLRRCSQLRYRHGIRDIAFLLNHLGLLLVMTFATLGYADRQQVKMVTVVGASECRALAQDGTFRMMPLTIELKRFTLETYDDGTPKRYASELRIKTQKGDTLTATVEVNKPVEVDGWMIYQYGYDTQKDAKSQTSVLELVSDPWLPFVYTGICMMLAGVLLLLTYTQWSYKRLLPIGALVVVALCIVSYLMPVIRTTQPVPALQSPWFTPHVLAYIVCYSLMGVAAVMAFWHLADNLVYVGLIFMTFGMMFGAFWAKEAWGHYWSWDPKETWAAITWFSYLLYFHYRRLPNHRPRLARWLLILSFLLLQMCWWGLKLLPSVQGTSLHVYGANS